ncbi:bile acid:sodium symporter [Gordonia sp. CPCC 205515]|uniref:bile acid:sodium symporter n=1 Tax=Gordonia sp. CPCC 205515 TaxID=3140791 RepID=UPI003AF3758F
MRLSPDLPVTLERHQVTIYLTAIVVGAIAGLLAPGAGSTLEHVINPALAALLYVTFLQVPIGQLVRAVRDARFLGVLLVVNFVVVPLVVAALYQVLPADNGIRAGVLLVLLCPCVDYVIVFSGLAGGDSRRLLAATPLLLLVQMALLPLFLALFLGDDVASVVDATPFLTAFIVLILIPLVLAWLTQVSTSRSVALQRFRSVADGAMVPLMALVLFVVVASQMHTLDDHLGDIVTVIPVYVVFLAVMVVLGLLIARWAGLDLAGRRAVGFSGATRNSLVVLPLALALPAEYGVAASVVVLQTLIEVVGMVVLVAVVPRVTSGG